MPHRRALHILLPLAVLLVGCARPDPPRVERLAVPAPSLAGSVIPNASTQPALVLLPPSYHQGSRSYPVVYYLPGFATDATEYLDGSFDGFHLDRTLDAAVENGTSRELIVVIVNGRNALGGCFYVNSPVTGRFEDYVVEDVIGYVEERYRIRREPACRGVAGDSMGGFGALHLAMRHPDVFGAAFAESPGLFDEEGLEDEGMLTPPYAAGWRIQTDRMRTWPEQEAPARLAGLSHQLLSSSSYFSYRMGFDLAYGAAFSPAPDAGPPFVSWDPERLRSGFGRLAEKVARHREALAGLRGLQIDIGRRDRLAWIPRGARRLSQLLGQAGIEHRLTEHDGGHEDRLGSRLETEMLPFFSRVLCPESGATNEPEDR